jgi:tetratricopeptide (TPR) repeat protein
MPAHIYYRLGRYKDSLAANIAAVKADEEYFAQIKTDDEEPFDQVKNDGMYRYAYYPHNVHFLLVSAQMQGDGPTAIAAANKLSTLIPDPVAHEHGFRQHMEAARFYAHAQFSDVPTILTLPEPGSDFPFLQATWHYARAVAFATHGDVKSARNEEKVLAESASHTDYSKIGVPAAPAVVPMEQQIVLGRIAQAEGRNDEAIAAFRDAVSLQDQLPYMEPPFWYYPVRQSLGGAQLAAGKLDDAIQTFRDCLARTPNNAYALYGLTVALKEKGDTAGASAIEVRFEAAWSGPGSPDLKAL